MRPWPTALRSLLPHVVLFLALAAALAGCDEQRATRLEEGVSTEADVRRQFGEPAQVTERADGSRLLSYPRQPEGWTNYEMEIGADGKLAALRQLLTEANFAKVQPGMPQAAVAAGLCERHTPSGVALRGYVRNEAMRGRIDKLEVVWHRAVAPGYGWIFGMGGVTVAQSIGA